MVSVGFRGSSTSLICGIYISKAIALNLQGRVSALKITVLFMSGSMLHLKEGLRIGDPRPNPTDSF